MNPIIQKITQTIKKNYQKISKKLNNRLIGDNNPNRSRKKFTKIIQKQKHACYIQSKKKKGNKNKKTHRSKRGAAKGEGSGSD
jgi:hypothetical protein